MAKIWPVYDGRGAVRSSPWATIPLDDAIKLLQIGPESFIDGPDIPPKAGELKQDIKSSRHNYLVVEVGKAESKGPRWKAGFYRIKLKPNEVFELLLRQAATKELGSNNVLRVFSEPAIDSNGHEALRITVVIADGTTGRVANNSVLNAVVGLRERLREMRDERVPIIEYATEEELKTDAGH